MWERSSEHRIPIKLRTCLAEAEKARRWTAPKICREAIMMGNWAMDDRGNTEEGLRIDDGLAMAEKIWDLRELLLLLQFDSR